MDKELMEKLRESLIEKGVDEKLIEETFKEVVGESVEEKPMEDTEEEVAIAIPVEEEVEKEDDKTEEVEPSADKEIEEPLTEEQPSPELEELPEEKPMELPFDYVAMENEIEELKKANEGLQAAISSLKEALYSSGILEGKEEESFGFDKAEAPANDAEEDAMEKVLREINRK